MPCTAWQKFFFLSTLGIRVLKKHTFTVWPVQQVKKQLEQIFVQHIMYKINSHLLHLVHQRNTAFKEVMRGREYSPKIIQFLVIVLCAFNMLVEDSQLSQVKMLYKKPEIPCLNSVYFWCVKTVHIYWTLVTFSYCDEKLTYTSIASSCDYTERKLNFHYSYQAL